MSTFFVSIHTNLVNYKSLFICPNLTMFCCFFNKVFEN